MIDPGICCMYLVMPLGMLDRSTNVGATEKKSKVAELLSVPCQAVSSVVRQMPGYNSSKTGQGPHFPN
jgi:hypothetical protein